MSAALTWLDTHGPAALMALQELCAIPSVSTDPAYRAGMQDAANWLARHLDSIGLQHVAIRPTAGHPVVTADWVHAPGAPTLLIYAHYDVQPPDPAEGWLTPAFAPTIRDGRLYARGASDDKGPMMVALTAIAALIATGTMAVNLKLLLEGEEEAGSANLEGFVAEHAALLRADWVLSADGARWRTDLPTLTVASRGLCALEVMVHGAAKDLHSGRHGGLAPNPIQALVTLLAGLHVADGGIAVPGFLDRVRPVGPAELTELVEVPFDEAGYATNLNLAETSGEAGFGALARNWLRPTLEFNGISGGYAGPGSKTVIPARAFAKITCRLVPDQEPTEIAALVAQDLRRRAPRGVRLEVTVRDGSARPYAIDPGHRGLALAEDVLEQHTGRRPLRVRMGATLPVSAIFRDRLGIDTVLFSFATSDEDYHAPNEFFRLTSWKEGLRAWVDYLIRAGHR